MNSTTGVNSWSRWRNVKGRVWSSKVSPEVCCVGEDIVGEGEGIQTKQNTVMRDRWEGNGGLPNRRQEENYQLGPNLIGWHIMPICFLE